MDLECVCGLGCVEDASLTLKNIKDLYSPCNECRDPKLKKFKALKDQIDLEIIDENFGRCNCGKRHLDVVISHILKIMIEEGIKNEKSTLRNACNPLITPAYPTKSVPYLSENSMVILTNKINSRCAKRIINEVPEIKGVLEGDMRQTVGLKDSNSAPHVYKLLAGCDMRCDVVITSYGRICIYRNQSEIHLEFSKPISPKVELLKKFMEKYTNPNVLDCTCGPGTLGIYCLKAGANRVVFNDLWYPAAKMTAINLEVNGFETDFFDVKHGLIGSGKNFEIYCEDIINLKEILNQKFDICIIDTFPDVDTNDFIDSVKNLCRDIVVI